MNVLANVYVFVALGIISRTVVPYLVLLQSEPETPINKKFIVPLVISVLVNLLLSPMALGSLSGTETWFVAYAFGWGSTDIVREGVKFVAHNVTQLKALG